jgi:hypothetical protein
MAELKELRAKKDVMEFPRRMTPDEASEHLKGLVREYAESQKGEVVL